MVGALQASRAGFVIPGSDCNSLYIASNKGAT